MGEDAPFGLLVSSLQNASFTAALCGLLGLLGLGILTSYILILLVAHTPRHETSSERIYRTITKDGKTTPALPLPDTYSSEKAEVVLSVVVPAYNESERLPGMLAEAVTFLHDEYGSSKKKINGNANGSGITTGWEILVVDDGSTDSTAEVALDWARSRIHLGEFTEGDIRVCVLEKNRGKGGAVTHGMRHVRGEFAVFADADGASKFSDVKSLLKELRSVEDDGFGIAVGSRAHMVTTDAVVKRSFIRNFLMHSFHTLLKTFGIRHIHDTQCGFKLFSRAAIKDIFPFMHTEGWIFDIEILLLAGYLSVPVVEVPITWHEVTGTKMRLVQDSIRMAWDLGVVRLGYIWGVYRVGLGGPSKKRR
ncbi:hypothetical protein L873DRAFT_1840114 [Choiromyces venosus 120613-1]|uniref:dolichyl-phosphate beta-glucosyltransferase n=1 Tax=Choiromyces venosus 120613-1 TaxID=1336337 RepID=A0A3N4K3J2_9PEZI|nr:hypothetical protein L873DRAFT_1840114 [Choiromyces venosus 120613-1]